MDRTFPWVTNRPDKNLIDIIKEYGISPGKVLEIGCGYGDNSIWLARQGFDVTGIDISDEAIKYAINNAEKEKVNCNFIVCDFIKDPLDRGSFDLVFDRGCFHSRDFKKKRKIFARSVSSLLKENGYWLSLIGNKDTSNELSGPPKLSALEIVKAVEPEFKIIELKASVFDSDQKEQRKSWLCLMKKR